MHMSTSLVCDTLKSSSKDFRGNWSFVLFPLRATLLRLLVTPNYLLRPLLTLLSMVSTVDIGTS